jgi:membrane associated rhomboid family serine protease
MNASERHTDPPNDAIECLIRIQQVLLGKGYRYLEGDRNAWPNTPVRMTKYEASTLIVPYHAGTAAQVLEAWDEDKESAGLLLIGRVDIGAPEIDTLLAHKRSRGRKLAYIDASRQQFRTPMNFWSLSTLGKGAFLPGNIRAYFDRSKHESSSRIDCVRELSEHIAQEHQSELFVEAMLEAAGTRWPLFTLAAITVMTAVFVLVFNTIGWRAGAQISRKELIDLGALFGPLVREGQVWRMLYHPIPHMSIEHFLSSMIAFGFSGQLLERLQGKWRALISFSAGTFVASVAVLWAAPQAVIASTSGGIFGMIGALIAVHTRFAGQFPKNYFRAWGLLLLVMVMATMPMASGDIGRGVGIAIAIGGFVGGSAFGFVAARPPTNRSKRKNWVGPAMITLIALSLAMAAYVISRIPE